jgi:hypothetical protein
MKNVPRLILSLILTLSLCLFLAPYQAGAESNVTTVTAISQSTSSAWNYLKNNVGTIKASGLIPGLNKSVTRTSNGKTVTVCKGMVPQGITFAGDYLLISAYCGCGKNHRSVIYVIDDKTRKYKTTLILDNSCHVGGLAKCGDYVWVCDSQSGKYLRAYKYSSVKDAIGHNYWTVYTQAKRAVATTPSYMCSANGCLYVGTFSETSKTSNIYYYSVNGSALTKKGSFTISGVPKIQGISIRGSYMLITSSYGRTNKSKVYSYKFTGPKKYTSPLKSFTFPNMAEGCYIGSSNAYFLFESGAATYRSSKNTMPLDKYVGLSNSVFGIK